ncbi:Glycosyltransferase [Ignavibacterium album JCM 16511]|uniref:Glycosyltransferase n=1 Tax=Ignavibacterium album (strain DSM 19864 / JCM 16511 / NBRC 101810 / Mat9-16) TaxID=945713 RepID=I0AMF8_IGNAJ|nr:glycosyltransferase family 4 protein [Ignavibacterium album]AFH50165.1 Glycosyltransferase [Ignavibacterium album JCM 16511]
MIAQSTYDYDARIIRYCRALKEEGIETDVICFKYFNQKKFENVDGVNVYRVIDFNNKDSILRYIVFSFRFLIKAFFKTISLHKKNNYSVIHVHNMPDYLVFAALYPKIKKVPVLLDIHDLTVELFKEKWSYRKFKLFKPILIFTERISCNFAEHIITVTNECIENLVKRGIKKEKISLIMNAPDDNLFTYDDLRFRKNGSDKTFRILYHGTLAKRFGLHYVVEALKIVNDSYTNVEFHIYGNTESEYVDELKSLAKKIKISDKIFFNQSVHYNKVNDLIKNFDLGIVTYEPTEYMHLAFPTKAGEYALTGLPIIITKLESIKTIFSNESVIYIEMPDPRLIAEHLKEIISNSNKRKQLSLNARNDIEKVSWSKMKQKYLLLISSLIKS